MLNGVDGGKQSVLLFYEILILNQNVRSTTSTFLIIFVGKNCESQAQAQLTI